MLSLQNAITFAIQPHAEMTFKNSKGFTSFFSQTGIPALIHARKMP